MSLKIFAIAMIMGALNAHAAATYSTYVQANKAAEKGKSFFLVMVTDPANPKFDTGMRTFVLENNQTKTAVFGNKYFPGREYRFTVALKQPIVTVTVVLIQNGQEIFRTNEQFASWAGF